MLVECCLRDQRKNPRHDPRLAMIESLCKPMQAVPEIALHTEQLAKDLKKYSFRGVVAAVAAPIPVIHPHPPSSVFRMPRVGNVRLLSSCKRLDRRQLVPKRLDCSMHTHHRCFMSTRYHLMRGTWGNNEVHHLAFFVVPIVEHTSIAGNG